ncbi:hypothetical protein EAO27_06510 [Sphingopyxis sp. YF1]|uniref:hypothetical protein n=1 Tax=Sphingopyxis sp. YF1 TaxID=2482763 RepID=UPI001F6110E3|nr:hypothetical protein [Sphingopyxis sp. YF1]UNU42401.1 hypothetical protein EAO27_06510 [Sphingopyxis sp. YF1]HZG31635.1 hypothetical protein [Sphingopyxis sp.]
MFVFALLLATTSEPVVLHCRAEGAGLLATTEFTLLEGEGRVSYSAAAGMTSVAATFSADAVAFPDDWPKPFAGGYVIDRRALTYRHLVTHDGKTVLDEQGRCRIFSLPREAPEGARGERPPPRN